MIFGSLFQRKTLRRDVAVADTRDERAQALCANFVLQATNAQGLGTRLKLASYFARDSLFDTSMSLELMANARKLFAQCPIDRLSLLPQYVLTSLVPSLFFARRGGKQSGQRPIPFLFHAV